MNVHQLFDQLTIAHLHLRIHGKGYILHKKELGVKMQRGTRRKNVKLNTFVKMQAI